MLEASSLAGVVADPRVEVFVCGASAVAVGVQDALADLVGDDAVAAMVTSKRLHLEVFGSLGGIGEVLTDAHSPRRILRLLSTRSSRSLGAL